MLTPINLYRVPQQPRSTGTGCGSPDFGKVILGLIVSLIVLWIIENNAEEYATGYVIVLLLGIVVANSRCVTVFANQLTARL